MPASLEPLVPLVDPGGIAARTASAKLANASRRRACAASFVVLARRRNIEPSKSPRSGMGIAMANFRLTQ